MNLRKLNKVISRLFGWLGLVVCSLIIRLLPVKFLYTFAKNLARFGFLIAVKHRRIAQESLSIAFGREKSSQELRKIAQDCFVSMAKSGIEMLFFLKKPKLLKDRVVIENVYILDEALSRRKGAILVSGHFGNFPLMMLKLRLQGYPIGGIMRQMRDKRVEQMFAKLRQNIGIKAIHTQPRKECVDATIRALKNNEIVCIQLDQNFGTGGIFVDFLGRKAATATGPVIFAMRTKATLLPCFIVRGEDDTHRIIFEPEFKLKYEDDFNRTVWNNVQRLTGIIESYILRYPAQWGWIHRRWKTRPKQ